MIVVGAKPACCRFVSVYILPIKIIMNIMLTSYVTFNKYVLCQIIALCH